MLSGATSLISDIWGKRRPQENKRTKSFAISESRRAELLEEARSRRIAWVDGKTSADEPSVLTTIASDGSICLEATEEILKFLDQLSKEDTEGGDKNHSEERVLDNSSSKKYFSELMQNTQDNENISEDMNELYNSAAYMELLDILRQPGATDIVLSIQNFVKTFESQDLKLNYSLQTTDPPRVIFHAFIERITKQTENHRLLNDYPSLKDMEMRRDAFETFVMEKIYSFVFSIHRSEQIKDEELTRRIASLAFIRLEHLDITATSDELLPLWQNAQEKFKKINDYKSPGAKMNNILSVCQDITSILKQNHPNGRFPNADEFLPALIYVVLQANPEKLHSNIDFISQYRHPSKLVSEPGYFFTHMVSAVSFLENLDDSSLSISTAEFEAGIRQTKEKLASSIPSLDMNNLIIPATEETEEKCIRMPTVLDIRQKRLDMLTIFQTAIDQDKNDKKVDFTINYDESRDDNESGDYRLTNSSRKLKPNDFSFIHCTEEQLHLHDVPRLLREYKILYHLWKDLREEIAILTSNISQRSENRLVGRFYRRSAA